MHAVSLILFEPPSFRHPLKQGVAEPTDIVRGFRKGGRSPTFGAFELHLSFSLS